MRASRSGAIVALVGALVLACVTPPVGTGAEGQTVDPARESVELRPELMVADPERVSPGEHVALTFPKETGRGLGFLLEQRTDGGWQVRAYLTSAPGDGPPDEPAWHSPDEPPAWEALEIGGPGPDIAAMPGQLDAGSYRICTAMPGQLDAGSYRICTAMPRVNICTAVTVTR